MELSSEYSYYELNGESKARVVSILESAEELLDKRMKYVCQALGVDKSGCYTDGEYRFIGVEIAPEKVKNIPAGWGFKTFRISRGVTRKLFCPKGATKAARRVTSELQKLTPRPRKDICDFLGLDEVYISGLSICSPGFEFVGDCVIVVIGKTTKWKDFPKHASKLKLSEVAAIYETGEPAGGAE